MEFDNMNKPNHLFKVVMVGAQGVGKSSLLARLTRDDFDLCCNTTIGVQYSSRDIIDSQENIIRLQIWDPIIGDRFARIQRPYFRCAVACLLVFDVGRKETLYELDRLILQAKQLTSIHTVFLAVANKTDLTHLRQVSTEEARQFAELRGLRLIETSALLGYGSNEVLLQTCECVMMGMRLHKEERKTFRLERSGTNPVQALQSMC